MARKRQLRRRYLIDGRQVRFLVLVGIYFLVAVLVFATAIFAPVIVELGAEADSISHRSEVAGQFLVLHERFWPAALLVLALLAVHAVFVSHRVAGPLYRFRKTLEAMADGDLSQRVRLRKHDYLTEEAELLDRAIGALSERACKIDEVRRQLGEALEGLDRAVESRDRERMHGRLEALRGRLDAMGEVVDGIRYRTGED